MGRCRKSAQDFVETLQVLSDEQLSQPCWSAARRRTDGGLRGRRRLLRGRLAGCVAGWLAVITPAFAAIPLLVTIQRWLHLPRMRGAVDAVVIASAALLVVSGVSLTIDAVRQLLRILGG